MPLHHQIATRQLLRDLKMNPLPVLPSNPMKTENVAGVDTQSTRLAFGTLNGEIRISTSVEFARAFLAKGIVPDSVIRIQGLATPTRAQGAVGRLAATARFLPGANEIW